MKKLYSKPEIMFESFTLSTNVAGGCEVKTNTPADMQCSVSYVDEHLGDINIFLSSIQACVYKEPDGYNGICYDIPTEGNNLFNS